MLAISVKKSVSFIAEAKLKIKLTWTSLSTLKLLLHVNLNAKIFIFKTEAIFIQTEKLRHYG